MSDLVSEDHILARIASHFPNEGPDVLLGRGVPVFPRILMEQDVSVR